MRLPRTTGALSGVLIVLLGIWCGLIPFVGPYFHYAFGSYQTWHCTSDRLWLDILPGAASVLGGLLLVKSAHRISGTLGGWVAMSAGAWLLIGPALSVVWEKSGNAAAPIGQPTGGSGRQAIELEPTVPIEPQGSRPCGPKTRDPAVRRANQHATNLQIGGSDPSIWYRCWRGVRS